MNSHKTESFLILDDDEDFCAVLALSIEQHGYQTLVAHNIESALELAKQNHPQKAIIDLRIGNQSGLQAVAELKKQQPELQLLILTGYSSIATAVEAIKLGATHYLTKPTGISEILAAFQNHQGNPDTSLDTTAPSVKRLEWEHIQHVLTRNDGNLSATARELNMHRRTLQRKLQKFPVKK